jgi:proteic killer suppression protein
VIKAIKHFACEETERIFKGESSRKLPEDIQRRARKKLRMLNNSKTVNDLRAPPSNRLEKLSGDRSGQYSIRINDQWRICFAWDEGSATDVEITDYH